jgi:hypothetical protein
MDTILIIFIVIATILFIITIATICNKKPCDGFSNPEQKIKVWGWGINKSKKKMEEMSKYFLGSAKHYNIKNELIGLGWDFADWDAPVVNGDGRKAGKHLQKFYVLKERLEKPDVKKNDIILVMDAADTLFAGTADEILRRFLKKNTRLLISAEKAYTYQYQHLKKKFEDNNKEIGYKYINSGTYIGYADVLLELANACIALCCTKGKEDNQTVEMGILGMWVHTKIQNPRYLQIDGNCDIFWVTTDDTKMYLDSLHNKNELIYNKETKTHPLVLHLIGGPTRVAMPEMYKKILDINNLLGTGNPVL